MILVDSGVLIDFLRTKDAKLAALFRSLPVAVCGATRAEILCGARSSADGQRLVVFLSPFQQVSPCVPRDAPQPVVAIADFVLVGRHHDDSPAQGRYTTSV